MSAYFDDAVGECQQCHDTISVRDILRSHQAKLCLNCYQERQHVAGLSYATTSL